MSSDQRRLQRTLRIWSRRWRLWWRYQFKALRYRRPFDRLRLVRGPDDSAAAASGLQLFLARLLGRSYIWAIRVGERFRIQRNLASDRIEPGRVLIGLVRQQLGLLVWLVLLVIFGFVSDSLAPRLTRGLEAALGIQSWASLHLVLPGEGTMQAVLATLAAATGTILGIVLSITLIVFQTTAERYRTGRIMSFLLRERVTSIVIQLLALAFAYSLWVLMFFKLLSPDGLPYVSTTVALALSTAGVLALITYRGHALVGYLPSSIGRELATEMVRQAGRAQRPRSGPNIHQFAHDIVAQDLQTLGDLLRRLQSDADAHGAASIFTTLDQFLKYYIRTKRFISGSSRWWARRRVRSDSPMVRMSEQLASEGLMDPMSEEPDRLWVERAILDLAHEAMTFEAREVRMALVTLLFRQLQFAFYSQEPEACLAVLSELRVALASPGNEDPALTEQLSQVPWLLFELSAKGPGFRAPRIVDAEPWRVDVDVLGLPWMESQEARVLAIKIRRERAIAGGPVTPRDRMVAEVERGFQPKMQEVNDRLLSEGYAWLDSQLKDALDRGRPTAGITAKQVVRALLRATHLRVPLQLSNALPGLLDEAYARELDATLQSDLREDTALLARRLAEDGEWPSCWIALRASSLIGLRAEVAESEVIARLGLTFDSLMTLAHIHAWGEFASEPEHLVQVSRYLDKPWRSLDGLASLVTDENFSSMRTLDFANGVKYHRWFQSLISAVEELPPKYESVGSHGIPFEIGKQHPSTLFSQWQMFRSYDECLKHLVISCIALRGMERRRLVNALEAITKIKQRKNP